ncbi:hypothetical protein NC652_017998 [Populus alba x Populus x berolinensis]|nr:hypothetical protein NC652_017998 [Populus alba x Populus x berolinensis]
MIVFFVSGEYLALTGDKLNGVEMIACGLASHYALHEIRQASCASLRHLINVSATIQLRKLLMHWKMRKLALMMNGVKEPSAKKKEAAPLCLKVTLQLIREDRSINLLTSVLLMNIVHLQLESPKECNDFCEWDP